MTKLGNDRAAELRATYGVETTDGEAHTQVDWAYENETFTQTHAESMADAKAAAERHNLRAKDAHATADGWPIVDVAGAETDLLRFLDAYDNGRL